MEFFPENLCLRIRKTLPQILHQTPHVSRLAEFYHVLKTKSVSEIWGGGLHKSGPSPMKYMII